MKRHGIRHIQQQEPAAYSRGLLLLYPGENRDTAFSIPSGRYPPPERAGQFYRSAESTDAASWEPSAAFYSGRQARMKRRGMPATPLCSPPANFWWYPFFTAAAPPLCPMETAKRHFADCDKRRRSIPDGKLPTGSAVFFRLSYHMPDLGNRHLGRTKERRRKNEIGNVFAGGGEKREKIEFVWGKKIL